MITAGELVRGGGGLLLVVLGAYVASLRGHRRENLAFAAFCVLSGAGFAIALVPDGALDAATSTAGGILFAGAGIALARVAVAFPRPLEPNERALARNAAILCVALGIVQGFAYVSRNLADPEYTIQSVRVGAIVEDLGLTAFRTAAWFGGLLAALRFARATGRSVEEHRAFALLSVALAVYPVAHGPYHLIGRGREDLIIGAATSGLLLAIVVAFLHATTTTRSGPLARWSAWLLLAVAAGAMVFRAGWWDPAPAGPTSLAVVAMFATLTYAILHHQLLGIDVKVRWAISKSTVAAVFVAVFFVASEAAQQLFGATLGGTYAGIIAAGALVFALAPLQRAAERLAERAVPIAAAQPAVASEPSSARETYRVLLERVLRDGRVDRREERALAHAATSLGLTPQEALALRHEIEDERATGGA